MNLLVAAFLLAVLLLALDLLTAPKPSQAPRPHLKDHGRIA
jgi:hypothetical protein